MRHTLIFMGITVLLAGCSGARSASSPVAPSGAGLSASDDSNGSPSHGLPLLSPAGEEFGGVNVTANGRTGTYTLNTQDSIHVHGLPGDIRLYVMGAGDTGLPGGQQADRVCQRAQAGMWGPVATFPGGPQAIIETSPGGAGSVHIADGRNSPALFDGAETDIRLRVVDALPPAVPTIDLRTPCFTLTVK